MQVTLLLAVVFPLDPALFTLCRRPVFGVRTRGSLAKVIISRLSSVPVPPPPLLRLRSFDGSVHICIHPINTDNKVKVKNSNAEKRDQDKLLKGKFIGTTFVLVKIMICDHTYMDHVHVHKKTCLPAFVNDEN